MARGHLTGSAKKLPRGGVRGDLWWSFQNHDIDDMPKNFTPGLIPILETAIDIAIHEKVTKRAVLCRPGVFHIQSVFGFDAGWGCGYRNFQMALTALETSDTSQSSSRTSTFHPNEYPEVRIIQTWMKEAWDNEYDPQGYKDFKGSIVGTKKWIGTAVNFPAMSGDTRQKISPMHFALVQFVKMYFDGQLEGVDFGPTMRIITGAANDRLSIAGEASVTVCARFPLILQHSGHSRTIVGYEIDDAGETYLIVFDPATSIPRGIRKTALERYRGAVQTNADRSGTTSETGAAKRRKLGQRSLRDMIPKSRSEGQPTDPIVVLESDEEMDQEGWVRKKASRGSGPSEQSTPKRRKDNRMHLLRDTFDWSNNPKTTLGHFRVSLSSLSKHDEYQILSFDGGALLSMEERLRRKIVTATTIFPA